MTVGAVLVVAAVLAFAIIRPRGLPEYIAAVPAAILVVAVGMVSPTGAWAAIERLGPTVGFLAAVLVIAYLADTLGLFAWMTDVLRSAGRGSPTRLLALVFVAASLTTAALSLDATVVLLTPAIVAAAHSSRIPPRPFSFACGHLANTASLVMPVSNLTNLLAFSAVGIGFLHFTALMALPWAVAVAIELVVFLVVFRNDLRIPAATAPAEADVRPVSKPALTILALTLAGFAVSGFVQVEPVWIAAAGAVALAVLALWQGRTHPKRILVETAPEFLVFVFALGVVVTAVSNGPAGRLLADHLPSGTGLADLLVTAAIAALLANLINNLPAILMLLAALGAAAPTGLVLAALIGVNLGPNLTYIGSLATMLWRRVLHARGETVSLTTFTVLGLITTPLTLLGATTALWLVL